MRPLSPAGTVDLALIAALFTTALALGPALAHLFAAANKLAMPQDECVIAQKAYRGWDRLGFLIVLQFACLATFAILSRRDPPALAASLLALAFFAGAQAVFWLRTFPTNRATTNWTTAPEDWEALRREWEYSHAAGAALQIAVLITLLFTVFRFRRLRRR